MRIYRLQYLGEGQWTLLADGREASVCHENALAARLSSTFRRLRLPVKSCLTSYVFHEF